CGASSWRGGLTEKTKRCIAQIGRGWGLSRHFLIVSKMVPSAPGMLTTTCARWMAPSVPAQTLYIPTTSSLACLLLTESGGWGIGPSSNSASKRRGGTFLAFLAWLATGSAAATAAAAPSTGIAVGAGSAALSASTTNLMIGHHALGCRGNFIAR